MKKFVATLLLLLCSQAHADLTNLDSFIFDSSGNSLNSTSGALNAFLTNTTIAVTQSGTWTFGRTWNLSSGSDSVTSVQGTAASLSGAWPFKLTDGTNTMPTADVASRKLFSAITDGTNTMAVKAASTAAAASDPSAVVALSPNSPVPAGTNIIGALSLHQSTNVDQLNGNTINTGAGATSTGTARVASNLYDSAGNGITSSTSNSNQLLHVVTPDTTVASTALGALNATISISMQGLQSAGFQLAAGTLVGTIVPEASVDGGTTWTSTLFYNPSNQSTQANVVFGSSNTLTILGIVGFPGISNVRVRVSAYTSGTANAQLRAATVPGSSPSTTISAAFGTATNTYPSVTSSATQVVGANTNRKYLLISNNSGSQMNCQFGSGTGLTTSTGFIIAAKAFYEFKGDNLFTGAMFCIGAGTIATSVTEGTP